MSGTGKCPAGCGRTVLWTRSPNGKNLPLNPAHDPAGVWIPLRGRAWHAWELVAKGEPWSDWAKAPAHVAHPTTCPLWNPVDPDPHHGTAQGHLACMACGTVDATVRHATPELDLCAACRNTDTQEAS